MEKYTPLRSLAELTRRYPSIPEAASIIKLLTDRRRNADACSNQRDPQEDSRAHERAPAEKRAPLARGSSIRWNRVTQRYLLPAFSCCSFAGRWMDPGLRCAGVCCELPWPLVEGLLAPSLRCDGACC